MFQTVLKDIRAMNVKKRLFILLDIIIILIWLLFVLIFLFANITMQVASLFLLMTFVLILFSLKFTLSFNSKNKEISENTTVANEVVAEVASEQVIETFAEAESDAIAEEVVEVEVAKVDEVEQEVEEIVENEEEDAEMFGRSNEARAVIEPAVIDSDNPEKGKAEALEHFERANQELKVAQLAVLEHYIQKLAEVNTQLESAKWEVQNLQTKLERANQAYSHSDAENHAKQQELGQLLREKSELIQENRQCVEDYNRLLDSNEALQNQFIVEKEQLTRQLTAENQQLERRLSDEKNQLNTIIEQLTAKNNKLKRAIQQLSEE